MSERLEVLLIDYEATRDDSRQGRIMQSSAFGLAVAVLGILATLLANKDVELPDAAIAGSMMIPVVLLAYVQAQGAQLVMISYYLRSLEREIREEAHARDTQMRGAAGKLPLASYGEIDAITGGVTTPGGHGLVGLVLGGLTVVFLGAAAYAVTRVTVVSWRLTMLAVYSACVVIIVRETHRYLLKGRTAFKEVAKLANGRYTDDLSPKPKVELEGERSTKERPLWSYLLIPRPDDLIKGLFFVGFYVVGLLVFQPASTDGWAVLWVVVALEYLIYQARYQWNDIRGVDDDAASPEAAGRGRLPGGRDSVGASLWLIAARSYAVLVLASTSLDINWTLLYLFLAVWLLAVIYEAARTLEGKKLPEPLTPEDERRSDLVEEWQKRHRFAQRLSLTGRVLVFATVGCGYAIRGAAGLVVAAGMDAIGWPALILAALFLWSLGLMFVYLTWVLEGSSYCLDFVGPERVAKDARKKAIAVRPQTDGPVRYLAALDDKPHVRIALEQSGVELGCSEPGTRTSRQEEKTEGALSRTLLRRPRRAMTLWNAAMAISVVCGILLAAELSGLELSRAWWFVAVIAVMLAGLLAWVPTGRLRTLVTLGGGAVVSLTPVAAGWVTMSWRWIGVSSASWLTVSLVYTFFHSQCYADTRGIFVGPSKAIRTAWDTGVRLFLGSAATSQVRTASSTSTTPASQAPASATQTAGLDLRRRSGTVEVEEDASPEPVEQTL